jgi:putative ATPase
MIADSSNSHFVKLNAISSGVADAKEVIEKAKKDFEMYGKRTYLLLDEIHRWSKNQQDTLLASLESGHICLIGSTTESPYHALNRAIVSRCSVFEFCAVEVEDIKKALLRAIAAEDGLKVFNIQIDDDALTYFATACGGDVRSALNGLEVGAITTAINANAQVVITKDIAVECLQKKALSLNEDVFYHITSAFCKSLRGSDATAALYYAFRLIEAGCEPQYLARRCIAHASEDVGMADSQALAIACNALYVLDNLGVAEGSLALTHAIIYICKAPKDNTVVVARDMAIDDAQNHPDDNIPEYLKNHIEASAKYKYPHDYPGGVVEQQYLPNSLKGRNYLKKKD